MWTWIPWISKRRFAGTKHCEKCDESFIQVTELLCVVRFTGLHIDAAVSSGLVQCYF
jgi:hypothetical protein